jgi:hypothetical protein
LFFTGHPYSGEDGLDNEQENRMSSEELKREISRWAAREVELAHRKGTLEAQATAMMVDHQPGGAPVDNEPLAKLLIELRTVGKALVEAHQRRADAVVQKRQAETNALGNQIETLQKEAAELIAQVEQHKKQIGELLGTPVDVICPLRGQSRLERISMITQGTTEQIVSRQRFPVPSTGSIDLMDCIATADEVALAVLSTESNCPTAEAVLEWYAKYGEPAGKRRVYLTWQDGQINTKNSYVQALQVARA